LESIIYTNKTSKTIDFWDAYVAEYTVSPIYTATGSYDAIYAYAYAFNESQSLNTDTVITQLEALTTSNSIEGSSGRLAFDSSHCIVEGWPFGVALAIQWYDGGKILVPGVGIYPSDPHGGPGAEPSGTLVDMLPLQLPSWGLNFYD
ncbi:unnamed protein product, partial [marine sediment metagenome]